MVNYGKEFQSTQPKRAATTLTMVHILQRMISIHAAQEGCDYVGRYVTKKLNGISIHAAQEGCDYYALAVKDAPLYISIHAAQEGCDMQLPCRMCLCVRQISIHAAQEGCDYQCQKFANLHQLFISIHAAQEGCDLQYLQQEIMRLEISIHAAQEGCDYCKLVLLAVVLYFNPRSPRGLRR